MGKYFDTLNDPPRSFLNEIKTAFRRKSKASDYFPMISQTRGLVSTIDLFFSVADPSGLNDTNEITVQMKRTLPLLNIIQNTNVSTEGNQLNKHRRDLSEMLI